LAVTDWRLRRWRLRFLALSNAPRFDNRLTVFTIGKLCQKSEIERVFAFSPLKTTIEKPLARTQFPVAEAAGSLKVSGTRLWGF